MSWLLRDGDVLAVIEDRRRGWQKSLQGAVLVRRPALLPAVRGPLDVAWCNPDLAVKRIWMAPRWVAVPHVGVGTLVVAPAGSFDRWHLRVGDQLEVKKV